MSLQNISDFSLMAKHDAKIIANEINGKTDAKNRVTAIYLRLSKDDKNMDESESIENQRKMLMAYTKENGLGNVMEFVDDGWTGVDFQKRPGFLKMMSMIESSLVGTVVVKDLSRMGRERNYMGIFLEYVLPKYGVRFIAIGDSIDSLKGENDLVPLINLFNEWHVKNTSMKVRAVKDFGARQGKLVNGSAPYGYKYDRKQEKLVVDEVAAQYIKRIFQLSTEGNGFGKIAKILTKENVPTYSIYHGYNSINPDTAPEI